MTRDLKKGFIYLLSVLLLVNTLFVFADDGVGDADILERLLVLEHVEILLLVHVDKVLFGKLGLLDLVNRADCAVRGAAGNHVLELAAVKRLAFSGLAEIEFRDDVRLAVHLDFQSFA